LQGRGEKADVDKRVAQLKDEIETSPSEWEKEKLKERLAKLSTGVAAIKVTVVELVGLSYSKPFCCGFLIHTLSALR